MKKIEGYAFLNEQGEFLILEHFEGNPFAIEIYTTDSADVATIWDKEEEADKKAIEIIQAHNKRWNQVDKEEEENKELNQNMFKREYALEEKDKPTAIVKITKLIHSEVIKKL